MCIRSTSCYTITKKLREKLLTRDISLTIKDLNKTNVSSNSKILILSVLVQDYSMRVSIRSSIVKKCLTSNDLQRDACEICIIGEYLIKLKEKDYNNAIKLVSNSLNKLNAKSASYLLKALDQFDWSKLTDEDICGLDYNKPLLKQIESIGNPIIIKCAMCGKEKPRSEFRYAYTYCRECQKEYEAYGSVCKVNLKNRLMANEAAMAIKK